MRNVRILIILFVALGFIVCTGSPALAARGCEPSNPDLDTQWDAYLDQNLPGTKINASIAIYYGPPIGPVTGTDPRTMYVMIKARRTADVCAFSGIIPTEAFGDFEGQFREIGLFIEDVVIPQILDCDGDDCPMFCHPDVWPNPDPDCDCGDLPGYFSLKSIDGYMEDNPTVGLPGSCGWNCCDFNFMFVDVIIAIVD